MKKLIFRGPVQTASGYGVYARSVLKSLIDSGKYDITVMSVPWGATPLIYDLEDPLQKKIVELAKKFDPSTPIKGQFDVSVQVTIPNEFMHLAQKNIGVTAGIESEVVAPKWVEMANNMDLVIVPSEHAMEAFRKAVFVDNRGGRLFLKTPVVVVPGWIDSSVFNTGPAEAVLPYEFDTDFNFLAVGLGLDRPNGEDRKNFGKLIQWFCEQFSGRADVGLVLKLSIVNGSPVDYYTLVDRISSIKRQTGCGQLPKIHLIHGRMGDRELAALYKHPKVKAYVTLTHGEGFGLPIIEAAACGLPIVATDWSGHVDFLRDGDRKLFVPIKYELKDIPGSAVWEGLGGKPGNDVMPKGSKWAWPVEDDAKLQMAKLVLSYEKPKEWANDLSKLIGERFSEAAITNKWHELVDGVVGENGSPAVKASIRASDDGFLAEVKERRKAYDVDGKKTLIYTMPASAGDVYTSTSIVSSLRKKFPDHCIYFATSPKFMPILAGNPDIDVIIPYDQSWMVNVRTLEFVFDEVFTPNLDVQLITSNWIRNGSGRKLEQQFATSCLVEPGEKRIVLTKPKVSDMLPDKGYIVFHPGSGRDNWGARRYKRWAEVVDSVSEATKLPIVQVGSSDDELYGEVIDARGTTYCEMAYVISRAKAAFGIDSFPMHLAGGLGINHVNIFGSTCSGSTSPFETKASKFEYIETPDRKGCKKACYLSSCIVDKEDPCVNAIEAGSIAQKVIELVN